MLGGDTRYEPVYTGSMEPAIGVGSVVVIKPVNPETLNVGDVICYSFSESTTITHRVVNITDEGFITKGDANDDPDQRPVKKEEIIGKVILTIPFVGYLGAFVRTPIGFILLVVTPATILIILETKNIIDELKKPKQTRQDKTTATKPQTKPGDTQRRIKDAIKILTAKITKTKLHIILAAIFLITALILWLYSTAVIFGHEQTLATPNLPIEEVWRYEGSLEWWRNTYATTIIPSTAILIAAALATLATPTVLKKTRKTKPE